METYYVNDEAQSNGDHEVHRATCQFLPVDRKYLGIFADCRAAVARAKEIYSTADGCYWCCRESHTS